MSLRACKPSSEADNRTKILHSLRLSPGSLRNAKYFTEHEGRRLQCYVDAPVRINPRLQSSSITQKPMLPMMHSIHTFIAGAVFHTYWAQGKNRTGPWKVPWAALKRAWALLRMEQVLVMEQRSQFYSKGGWYDVNTKGNGRGKGSGTDHCEHRTGKKRREMWEKGLLKDKGVGEERRGGERQQWWNTKLVLIQ